MAGLDAPCALDGRCASSTARIPGRRCAWTPLRSLLRVPVVLAPPIRNAEVKIGQDAPHVRETRCASRMARILGRRCAWTPLRSSAATLPARMPPSSSDWVGKFFSSLSLSLLLSLSLSLLYPDLQRALIASKPSFKREPFSLPHSRQNCAAA